MYYFSENCGYSKSFKKPKPIWLQPHSLIKTKQGDHFEIIHALDGQGECLGVPFIEGFDSKKATTFDDVIARHLSANPFTRLNTDEALATAYFTTDDKGFLY